MWWGLLITRSGDLLTTMVRKNCREFVERNVSLSLHPVVACLFCLLQWGGTVLRHVTTVLCCRQTAIYWNANLTCWYHEGWSWWAWLGALCTSLTTMCKNDSKQAHAHLFFVKENQKDDLDIDETVETTWGWNFLIPFKIKSGIQCTQTKMRK